MAPTVNPAFASDYLTKISRKNELITRLNTLHQSLSELSQNEKDRPKSLRALAGQLVSKAILSNADREVRLLSCCCIVDILRIYAPDAPYSDDELCLAFDGIIHAIRGLSTYDPSSGIGSKIFYILNNLSTVKSCSIIVYLADQGVGGAYDRLKEFFEALVSSIRTEHSDAVAGHIGSILQSIIEESESLDQELLDVLLSPLLPSAKQENPAAFNLVQSVLRRTTLALQGPISTFVNRNLAGSMCVDDEEEDEDLDTSRVRGGVGGAESDLSEHIYALIYELHKVSADILLRILPNICVQLQADESAVRLKAIRLLGRLFASPHADYGVQFARNFRDFLGRFVDIADDVRLEMIDCGFMIICHKPQLREVVVG
jgi:sister chromatid cohesion protein PDS5